MKLLQSIFAAAFMLFAITGFAAKQEKVLICHVGNETGPGGEVYLDDPTCEPKEANDFFCPDAGKIDLIVVAKPAKHLNNPAHAFDGFSDYEPIPMGASGVGTEDSDYNGIDDGCEIPQTCPCWAEHELQSVTVENHESYSCSAFADQFPFFALIQNKWTLAPSVEGGFRAEVDSVQGNCDTRDAGTDALVISIYEANACIAQIAARCAAIGDPIIN